MGVVIVARDAAGSLAAAVRAVEDDTGQIAVAVDPADTATWQVAVSLAGDLAAGAAGHRLRVVANPGGRTAMGLNRALAVVDTPVVARVDAHTVPPPGYLAAAVGVLEATGAAVVGGRQVAVGEGPVGRAVAAAMGTVLGSGGARHRVGAVAGPSETAYLGVFDRAWLDRVGGWDEALDRNQDYEVCHRIRRAGGLVWFDPRLAVRYRPRETWRGLAAQYHEFGRYKRRVMTSSPGSVRVRQIVPASLPAGLAVSAVLAARGRRAAAAVIPTAWLTAIVVSAIGAGRPGTPTADAAPSTGPLATGHAHRLRVAGVLAVMHLAWGSGFWRGRR